MIIEDNRKKVDDEAFSSYLHELEDRGCFSYRDKDYFVISDYITNERSIWCMNIESKKPRELGSNTLVYPNNKIRAKVVIEDV